MLAIHTGREDGMRLGWSLRHWAVAVAGSVLAAVVIAVPTGILQTPLYHRMTPATWWDYPALAVTAVLEGVLLASYMRTGSAGQAGAAQAAGGGRRGAVVLRGRLPGVQ